MPRINITCDRRYYPPNEDAPIMRDEQEFIWNMARYLPAAVIAMEDQLLLDGLTPESAVQVCIKRFHAGDVNVPNVGIEFIFTEEPPPLEHRESVAQALKDMFEDFFSDYVEDYVKVSSKLVPTRSLDIDWGPQHGYIAGGGAGTHLKVTTW